MKKEFIHYEQALALKELGFDEPCFGYFVDGGLRGINLGIEELGGKEPYYQRLGFHALSNHDIDNQNKIVTTAPTFSQAFRWFREKYNLNSFIIDSKSYNWYFNINNMAKDDVVSEVLYFKTYEEAELECLKKLIEIVKTDN